LLPNIIHTPSHLSETHITYQDTSLDDNNNAYPTQVTLSISYDPCIAQNQIMNYLSGQTLSEEYQLKYNPMERLSHIHCYFANVQRKCISVICKLTEENSELRRKIDRYGVGRLGLVSKGFTSQIISPKSPS
jgi:hypothetical protein